MAKKKTQPATVQSILKELEEGMRKGLGKKRLSKAAKTYLTERYTKSVTRQLDANADWEKARKRVLKVGKKLGAVAKVLSDGKLVLAWAAEAAADAIANDPKCPMMGSGRWCPPGD